MARLLVLVIATAAQVARVEACPPAVALTGDDALVQVIRDQLGARGIASATPPCPAVRARVERRGALLVVRTEGPGGVPIERAVSEAATAATVIESWTRGDVAEPLLAAREVPAREDVAAPALVAAAPPPPAASGIQLFAAEETSLATDRTMWQGLQLGACVMLGPVCVAGRVHAGKVVSRPRPWADFTRKGADFYAGVDVPIALGSLRLTLGFAAGYGSMFTHRASDGGKVGIEVSGPRAEAHAAVSFPLTDHIAFDVMTTGALTQATRMEAHGPDAPDPTVVFPDEPRGFLQLALGIRYGAL